MDATESVRKLLEAYYPRPRDKEGRLWQIGDIAEVPEGDDGVRLGKVIGFAIDSGGRECLVIGGTYPRLMTVAYVKRVVPLSEVLEELYADILAEVEKQGGTVPDDFSYMLKEWEPKIKAARYGA